MWRDSNEWFHSCINWVQGIIVAANSQNKVVRQFRGLSLFKNINTVPMDHATGLLNVFTNTSGALEKIRLPFPTSNPIIFPANGAQPIDTFVNFKIQRKLLFNAGKSIGFCIPTLVGGVETLPWLFDPVVEAANLTPRWSWVESNNIIYGGNGQVMKKYDEPGNWHNMGVGIFGITPPAPTLGVKVPLFNIQRAANVVTFNLPLPAATAPIAGFCENQLEFFPAGLPVTISDVVTDPTLNGNYSCLGTAIANRGQYNQVGGNIGPLAEGSVTVYYNFMTEPTPSNSFVITHVQRLNGVTQISINGPTSMIVVGENVTILALAGGNATMNGTFKVVNVPVGGLTFTYSQPGMPDVLANVPGVGQVKGGITNTLSGRQWRYAYVNSLHGVVGPASDPTPPLPGGGLLTNVRAYLTAPPTVDPQVDQIWWFATADGGGDYELVAIAPYTVSNQIFGDGNEDILLDETQLAPLINFAPPIGDKLVKSQGRLYLAGIQGNPNAIAYSAFDQYLVGERPEEAWFPNNRLTLPTGGDPIQAFGVILPGVVAFSSSNQMFMFKGQVEDITTTLPVNFTAILEELPWQTGAVSQQAIQSTPYGIVWVASDLTVKIWNGIFYGDIIGPRDLSENIYPLMRRVTAGQQSNIQSAFFNFLERDWFAITLCLDGATTPNYLVFFDLAQNANDNLGVFVAQPLIPINSIGVREDNNGGRHLILASSNQFYELRVASEMVNGVITNPLSPTGGVLTAYWQSGLVGSDTPYQMKMFRWGRLITDSAAAGFNLVATLVDDDTYTFVTPLSKALKFIKQKFTVNYKARRAGLTVMFPSQDESVAVQELSIRYNPAGEH